MIAVNFSPNIRRATKAFAAFTVLFVVLLILGGTMWQRLLIVLAAVGGAAEFGILCWHWQREFPKP